MGIRIRSAIRKDCPRILELVKELAIYEKAADAVSVTLDHFTDGGFGPNPIWWALVAEVDGHVEGFALYYVRFSTWKGQRMYLEDFIVTKDMRGKGLGKLLFDELIREGKRKNFTAMQWQVLDWNEPAINFYKKYNSSFDPEWVNCSIDL